jgi:hypothetical protein
MRVHAIDDMARPRTRSERNKKMFPLGDVKAIKALQVNKSEQLWNE